MSAEDLDKLFRDKLKNRPVAPSAHAWERLQARMEPAAPKLERKVIPMWYYSAAAAVTLLLGVGFWTAKEEINPLQPDATVATVQQPAVTAPVQEPARAQETQKSAQADFSTPAQQPAAQQAAPMMALAEKTEKNSSAQATGNSQPASKKENKPTHVDQMPVTLTPDATSEAMASAQPAPKEAVSSPKEAPALEIIVKLDNQKEAMAMAAPVEQAAPLAQEEERSGAGKVLKGIFKQVKNLKDGEKINLEELGITKHTFALETNIGNRKISKTIEL